ncbi:tRNA pseudouridine synthase D [Planctomycetes bacterium Pla163]|uniref:tRNA pseudouridine synthase D n=1 Tax=Rohdeia mirabilis TaxID=2528008 RepID=A0A518D225_9BACT|nr:tRNA pseudouridine synthase D [Planctomycetes bacterium Pla163]
MKLKLRPTDFRVREVLRDGYIGSSGDFNVYRITKRKLTSPEAATILATAAGVEAADVSMAGLKDRQGVTIQFMSVPGGRRVDIADPDLRIEAVGRADRPLESTDSDGNAFDIAVRALDSHELHSLRENMQVVREVGVPNYFDDQRFGNLRYNQGWVAKDLIAGRAEEALKRLLTAQSEYEQAHDARFKSGLLDAWGDWDRCLAYAKHRGQHRSLFQHLVERPNDFGGAFRYVATRIRLIHMYAWQSHLFNRALAERVRRNTTVEDRVVVSSIEGAFPCPGAKWPMEIGDSLLLPGAGLDDAIDSDEYDLYRDLLAEEGITPGQHRIEGIEGFGLKAERRPVRVIPQHLRVRPAEDDRESRGLKMVRVRFELPRGAYASLVVKRLVGNSEREERDERGERGGHEHRRPRTLAAGGFDAGARTRGGRPGGGYRGGDTRSGGGGYRGRDERSGGGGYRGGSDRSSGGGYRGGDDRSSGGGYRGGGDRSSGGGYRGGDDRSSGGGYRGGDDRSSGGGYRGGNDRSSGGGYRGGDDRSSGGGYRGGDDRSSGGGYRGGSDRSSGGGYRGGNDRSSGGGYRGGNDRSSGGGYRGGDDRSSGGGYRGGDDRSSGGGYRGGDDRSSGGGYRGGNDRSSGGGYRGGNDRSSGGGYRGGDDRSSGGGYRGADDRSSGGGYRGADDRSSGGGYRGGSDRSSGGGYRGGNDRSSGGGYRGGDDRSRGGGYRGGQRGRDERPSFGDRDGATRSGRGPQKEPLPDRERQDQRPPRPRDTDSE